MEYKPKHATGFVLTVALLIMNLAAGWGQAGWALAHVAPVIVPAGWDAAWSLALAVAFAIAIESVGAFLALSADDADERGLPSASLRLASYGVGLFVSGGLNLSHWGWGAAGVAFAFLSAISPFLWGVRARIRRNRVVAPSRRLWHPVRSVALIRTMAWEGIATEEAALAFLAGKQEQESVLPAVTVAVEPEPPIKAEAEIVEAPAPVRTPRAPRQRDDRAMLLALDMIKDGKATADVVAASGIAASTVRKYASVVRTLHADPSAEVDARRIGIGADVVGIVRTWSKGLV